MVTSVGGVPFSLAPGCALAAPRSSAGHRSPPLFLLIHRVSGALLCVVPQLRSGCIPSLQLRLRVGKAPAALMAYSAGCHPSLPRTAGVGGPELCPASPQIHQSKVVVSNQIFCSPFPSVSVFRRASSLGELRCCLVRERCIALPGRGLTFCHGNVAWVNRLERPETVRLPLALLCRLVDALGSKPSLFPGPAAAHRLCVRTRGPHHLSPHPRDGGDPRFSPDA